MTHFLQQGHTYFSKVTPHHSTTAYEFLEANYIQSTIDFLIHCQFLCPADYGMSKQDQGTLHGGNYELNHENVYSHTLQVLITNTQLCAYTP